MQPPPARISFSTAVQAKELLMSLDFPFGRMALAFCLGSLLTVTSAIADEATSQATNEHLVVEKLAARTGPESVVVESAGPYADSTRALLVRGGGTGRQAEFLLR
ncbi:hypothetical protein [Variovorax sp. AFSI2.2]|uniref:hypothetical protein n=1 Tax=Variovorax sp. AFSI2.2 TaxID=3384160 RepID=UPI003EBC1B79